MFDEEKKLSRYLKTMHPIHRAIGNTQLILPTNGIDNGQAQAGGTFLLLSLIETLEDALAVQRLTTTRISETDAGGSDDDTNYIAYAATSGADAMLVTLRHNNLFVGV